MKAALLCLGVMLGCVLWVGRDLPASVPQQRSGQFCENRLSLRERRVPGDDASCSSALRSSESHSRVSHSNSSVNLLWGVARHHQDAEVGYVMEHSDRCTGNWCKVPCDVPCKAWFRAPASSMDAVVAPPSRMERRAARHPEALRVLYSMSPDPVPPGAADVVASAIKGAGDVWLPAHGDAFFEVRPDRTRDYSVLACSAPSSHVSSFLAGAVDGSNPALVRQMARHIRVAALGSSFEPAATILWASLLFAAMPVVMAALMCRGRFRRPLWVLVALCAGAFFCMSVQVVRADGVFWNALSDDYELRMEAIDPQAFRVVRRDAREISFLHQFKFALVFESHSQPDYVTGMVYRALIAGSVPVYIGAENVDDYVPPNSIIKASDFASMSDLAAHLIELDRDPVAYRKLLAWKQSGKLRVTDEMASSRAYAMCGICRSVAEKITHKEIR